LLNSNIDSSGINASTESQKVILLGKAGSEIERDLSEQIAQNTFEVDAVLNRLEIADLSSISR
jgi:osmotically-inducible protein OsmY